MKGGIELCDMIQKNRVRAWEGGGEWVIEVVKRGRRRRKMEMGGECFMRMDRFWEG